MRVLVIGAGMAGLAAARDLVDAGRKATVLEARDRLGGRVYTRRDIVPGVPVEMGAEYLHGERVPTWDLVRKLGLDALHWEKQDDSLVRLETGELVTMREARETRPQFDVTRTWDLPDIPPQDGDENLHQYLTRVGFTEEQLQYTRRSYVNAMAESIHRISTVEARAGWLDETAGSQDWRVMGGYDALIDHLADGVDVRLNTVVKHVNWTGEQVHVETTDGQTFQAEQVLVTLPTGVLGSGRVTFAPALPDEKQTAIRDLAMGPGYKIVYVFDEPILPKGVMALYSRHNPPMWWSPDGRLPGRTPVRHHRLCHRRLGPRPSHPRGRRPCSGAAYKPSATNSATFPTRSRYISKTGRMTPSRAASIAWPPPARPANAPYSPGR